MENTEELTIIKDGVEVSCDVCFSFVSEDTNKGYVCYTDHSLDEEGNEVIYVSSFDPNDPEQNLGDVTDEEYEMAIEVLDGIEKKLGGEENE